MYKASSRKFKLAPCCKCGTMIECVHRSKTLKCWDCSMKMIKKYQRQHNALHVKTNYAEAINNK